jgi:hypothetical protein
MNKQNKQRIESLSIADKHAKYPSMPYINATKYSDSTANGLTKAIKDFLNLSGHQAERVSSMGRTLDNRKTVQDVLGRNIRVGSTQYIPGTSTNGTADISAIIHGRSVKIEVKIGKDRQSDAQRQYEEDVTRAGGVYFIARNFDEFIEWYDEFIAQIK